MAGLSIAGNKYEEYKHDANEVIHFKLVRQESDVVEDKGVFKPDMTHQLFGDSESIFGYRDLRVDIYCTAARMHTYVAVHYTDKLQQDQDGVAADDIMKILSEKLQPGYLTSKDVFMSYIPRDAGFKPYGEKIHEYKVTKEGADRCFEVFKTDIEAPGFRDFHERIQPFLMFYVDAASYIDVDDDRWMYYLLFEKYQSNGNPQYAFAGYSTVYNYFAYPARIRPRISQVLVLPPFQKQGHGARLIQTMYNDCYTRPEVLDITVEDPSENFQRVRDYVDVKNCSKLSSFHPDKLREGFSYDMELEAREKLKINKKQARRVYEILRLKATSEFDKEQFTAYRIDIKKRLNLPFQKNGRDFQKLSKALAPDELAATMNNLSQEQRLDYLQKAFDETVEEYRHIIERVVLNT